MFIYNPFYSVNLNHSDWMISIIFSTIVWTTVIKWLLWPCYRRRQTSVNSYFYTLSFESTEHIIRAINYEWHIIDKIMITFENICQAWDLLLLIWFHTSITDNDYGSNFRSNIIQYEPLFLWKELYFGISYLVLMNIWNQHIVTGTDLNGLMFALVLGFVPLSVLLLVKNTNTTTSTSIQFERQQKPILMRRTTTETYQPTILTSTITTTRLVSTTATIPMVESTIWKDVLTITSTTILKTPLQTTIIITTEPVTEAETITETNTLIITQETVSSSLTMTLTTNPETTRQDLEKANDCLINVNGNCNTRNSITKFDNDINNKSRNNETRFRKH